MFTFDMWKPSVTCELMKWRTKKHASFYIAAYKYNSDWFTCRRQIDQETSNGFITTILAFNSLSLNCGGNTK